MSLLNFKKSYDHFVVALVIGIWVSVFLIIIAPFDASDLDFYERLCIMPIYGLISVIAYVLVIPLQNWVVKNNRHESLFFEISIIVLFSILLLVGSFSFYKTSIVKGEYAFLNYTFEIFYPIFFIQLPAIIFSRWYISRKKVQVISKDIVLKGDNKLDVLRLKGEDLISISSADNYVTVAYLVNDVLTKKLLRTTLKSIELQLPHLVKVHRSHLINPTHFTEWKDANTVLLTQMEVPVSKNYKKDLLAMNHSSLKTNNSPQSL